MKKLELSKAIGSLAEYARELKQDAVVLTVDDKPVAALVPLQGADWEAIALGASPKFLKIIKQSRESLQKEGGISSDELRQRLGLKRRKRR